MKFLRFTNNDENYWKSETSHNWDIPLNLGHKKVGLSSFFVILKDNPSFKSLLTIRCNLIDATMENQAGILELIPVSADDQKLFTRERKNIGMLLIIIIF